ncbi:glycoside hydrolase family 2 TIM barrel-domain containing protein [Aporhodopirellula aestuarii]|uniref:Glycoside hydrolase family 2 catalytic domain-containing protein n=1 Tax=Aporhodopirellula aestuarii TaxID=2950107 RepID=A0ABT0U831_9BACT|nr:glycoside hydrolase family 2 TIM barrel-domain containing protein [Aporhodopirellula aestuarii]MCM2373108.1 hypothetical protein [Aporhodopirellula aestuarii]
MNTARRLTIFLAGLLSVALSVPGATFASEVTVEKDDQGHFFLKREGKPYFIYGAGGTDHLKTLVECGGNSIRTWGIESLEKQIDGKPLLDYCHELGITVTVGLWLEHERHGFDYSDPQQIAKQRDAVRQAVRQYKDHPAILMWGLGNEMEGPESDSGAVRIWKELNTLAKIVKSEDPNHPVMTVIAGASAAKIKGIMEHYPNIDVLGVNSYGAASSVASDVKAAGWNKPFALTEFGPSGHWEVPQTSWGAAIEPSSRTKAASYYVTQSMLADDAGDICVGSYCFLWGQKQEKTSTWYGMFLPSGEKLPQVDAMCRAWTGKWPANRCPKVTSLETELNEAKVAPGALVKARVNATDPEQDPLQWTWFVQAETTEISVGGDRESVPPVFPECIVEAKDGEAVIRTPTKPGNYRLFIIVRDGQGNASADNVCFQVTAS